MIVRLASVAIARALAGRHIGGDGTAALPVDTPRWLGAGADCAIQRHAGCPAELRLPPEPGGRSPVIHTPLGDRALTRRLDQWLAEHLEVTLPGTLVQIAGTGVLIRGASGSGKSETALTLLQAGHGLIGDDAVTLRTRAGGPVLGRCPPLLRGRLCVRGLGLLDVDSQFGAAARAPETAVALVVEVAPGTASPGLDGDWGQAGLLGRRIPQLRLAPGRPLASLITAAVHALRARGNTAERFAAEQRAEIWRCPSRVSIRRAGATGKVTG